MQVVKAEAAAPPMRRFGQFRAARLVDISPASVVSAGVGT